MSRRFKASKYKNAAPKTSKHEPWIRDLVIGSYSCSGSFIKASAAFAAFNVHQTGSQLAVVSLDSDAYTIGTNLPILNAHSDLVTDFDFSPFEDGLLATCSADSTVKIWSIDPDNLNDLSTLSPECVTSSKHRKVENVTFNPTVEYLISYTSHNTLTLWDVLANKELYHDNGMHNDVIMSHSWFHNGNQLATCAKDKHVRVIDPRDNKVVCSAISHDNAKDSRVLWLGDSSYILTTGFDSTRMRQIFLRDTRNFEKVVKSLSFDSSTGILIPMYDPDTKMLFIAGRGDTSISFLEFTESDPYLTDGFRYNGEQTKGACLVSKRALKVMDTEVNRVLQLTGNSVVSIPYHVPRKSYIDFHRDLYPETKGTVTSGKPTFWINGSPGIPTKISLDPKIYKSGDNKATLTTFKKSLTARRVEESERSAAFLESADKYKKAVPEPRPRKKSVSSGSSSDEVNDIIVGRIPVPMPRPRVVNNSTAAVSHLRTPSSFISRRAADFSRSSSLDDQELNASSGFSNLSTFDAGTTASTPHANGESAVNNNHNVNNNAEGTVAPKVGNGHSNHNLSDESKNGNCVDDHLDGNSMSTSDRWKPLESRSMSLQEGGTTGNSAQEQKKQPRMTVAERLKMFQQKNNPDAFSDENPDIKLQSKLETADVMTVEAPVSVISATKGEKPSAPLISKPERKITPPSNSRIKPKENSSTSISTKAALPAKRIDTVFGQVSKYRNFKAVALHKKTHIDNLRNISTTCPSESELIQANPERVAVPLNTPVGKLAIFEIEKPGRQPDGVVPALVHGTKVMDFMWDPFDHLRLAVGCDDGRICIWQLPEGGLKEPTNEPEHSIFAHAEKVYFVRFHPLAKDVLATGSYDRTIRIWNLETIEEVIQIHLSPEQILFSFAWSPCGSKFVTGNKDGKIRIYDPRVQLQPIVEGNGPVGRRGGRVCWTLEGKFIVVAGFDKSSERQVLMYNAQDLSLVTTVSLDVSPSILVPFYDEDSSILLLSGRGDSTIFAFDVVEEAPYLRQVSHHRCPGVHQGIAFLTKNACDVKNVEFAKALRLTDVAVEPWSFTVPRVKSEYFQDDLFPPTKLLWESTMTSFEWFSGCNVEPRRVSLKPKSMKSLGELSGGFATGKTDSVDSSENRHGGSAIGLGGVTGKPTNLLDMDKQGIKQQQDKLEQAMKDKFTLNLKLEQDSMEGVDESEWGAE